MTEDDTPISQKRGQIIEAAVAEFQEKGFAAASMDRISARAEVSKRTVYKHFESKENLFRSIVGVMSDRIADSLNIQYRSGVSIRQQLTNLAWAEGRLLTSPDVMSMARMIISETLRSPELAAQTQGKIDSTSSIVAMVRAAAEDGQLEVSDPEDVAQEFLALIKAKAFWPVIFGAEIVSQDEMARIVESSVEMILSRYGKA
jgi:TetR/AcrR family transcriptional regulator of autoinduction and epiphytic fitness